MQHFSYRQRAQASDKSGSTGSVTGSRRVDFRDTLEKCGCLLQFALIEQARRKSNGPRNEFRVERDGPFEFAFASS